MELNYFSVETIPTLNASAAFLVDSGKVFNDDKLSYVPFFMTSSPTKEQLISLVESMCDVQDRMLGARGMPEHIQRPHVDNLEALKAPVFFLFELLGYGTPRELSEKGIKRVWMASFRSSPGEYLEECLSLLRDYKEPISEYDGGTRLRQMINFFADMMNSY